MKKRRFYNNKKRNQKWTENESGRKIDFADKYVAEGSYSDKYDYMRPKQKKKKVRKFTAQTFLKILKVIVIIIVSIVIIYIGYMLMAIYIDRHPVPSFDETATKDTAETEEDITGTSFKDNFKIIYLKTSTNIYSFDFSEPTEI